MTINPLLVTADDKALCQIRPSVRTSNTLLMHTAAARFGNNATFLLEGLHVAPQSDILLVRKIQWQKGKTTDKEIEKEKWKKLKNYKLYHVREIHQYSPV